MKKLVLLVSLILLGCCYKKDKLKIKNKTSAQLFFETITIDKQDSIYYQNSAGASISPYGIGSPNVRVGVYSIKNDLLERSLDGFLYIVYYSQKDQLYIHKNIRHIVFDKRFKVQKYSLKELDSLNWVVEYKGD